MGHIFISYSRKDKEYVDELKKKLNSEGFKVWIDDQILTGSRWKKEIKNAIDSCSALIVVMSETASQSTWVEREINYAEAQKKPILPLLIENENSFEFDLGHLQYKEVSDGSLPPERFYENLREVVGGAEASPRTKTALFPDTNWKVYFESLLESQRIKSALAIESFIELQTETGKSLEEETKEFLKTDRNGVLAIIGDALSGKTSFMGRIIEGMASNAMQELKIDDTLPPANWIPIYIPLSGKKIDNFDTLYGLLPNKIKPWIKVRKEKKQEFVFGTSETKWLIYLDGLDEVWEDDEREATIKYLHQFLKDFDSSQIKIILTSRPWVGLHSNEDTQILEVEHLNWAQMETYLISFINPDTTTMPDIASYFSPMKIVLKEKVSEGESEKEEESELQKICSLPGYLSEFVNELPSSSKVSETEYPTEKTEGKTETEISVETKNRYSLASLANISNVNELILTEPISEEDNNRKPHQEEDEVIESFRIGVVVSNMYLKVWMREERRRSKDRQKLFEKTCELAAYMDGKKKTFGVSEALKILRTEKELNWLLNLGVLRREKRRYSFYQPLTAVSFATEYLRSYYLGEASGKTKRKQRKLASNFSIFFQQRVEDIFESLEGMPVQRDFLLDMKYMYRNIKNILVNRYA